MLLVRVLGDQDHEKGRHQLIIWCAKRYWKLGTHEKYYRLRDAGDTSVWDCDAVSKCGGSTLLPSPQSAEDQFVIDLGATRSEQSNLFTHTLGVSRRESEHDVLATEKTTDNVHRSLISEFRTRCALRRNARDDRSGLAWVRYSFGKARPSWPISARPQWIDRMTHGAG